MATKKVPNQHWVNRAGFHKTTKGAWWCHGYFVFLTFSAYIEYRQRSLSAASLVVVAHFLLRVTCTCAWIILKHECFMYVLLCCFMNNGSGFISKNHAFVYLHASRITNRQNLWCQPCRLGMLTEWMNECNLNKFACFHGLVLVTSCSNIWPRPLMTFT